MNDRDTTRTGDLAWYDESVATVYGYLLRRCGSPVVAEDLTSETFLAAADHLAQDPSADLSAAWLIGVARHKLVDHWRRLERDTRRVSRLNIQAAVDARDEVWDVVVDRIVAEQVLGRLGAQHRAALTLRYLDGLPVAEVAEHLDRTVGATEVLLVRARRAFRSGYEELPGATATPEEAS